MDLFLNSLGYKPIMPLYCYSNCPSIGLWSLPGWLLCPADTHHLFLNPENSFLSGTSCSRLILYPSCPSPRISHYSKEPWVLLLKNKRNQNLDGIFIFFKWVKTCLCQKHKYFRRYKKKSKSLPDPRVPVSSPRAGTSDFWCILPDTDSTYALQVTLRTEVGRGTIRRAW